MNPQSQDDPVQTFAQGQEPEHDRPLTPYLNNLSYNRDWVIEEIKFLFRQEVVARYEIGKRLILVQEHEEMQTFAQILKQHFSGLSRRSAYNYMMFSRKIVEFPKLKEFAEGGKNWSKTLFLLEACNDEELAALEAGETVLGITLDKAAHLSNNDLKKALKKTEKQAKVIKDLRKQIKELEKLSDNDRPKFLAIHHASAEVLNARKDLRAIRPQNSSKEIQVEFMRVLKCLRDDFIADFNEWEAKLNLQDDKINE